jgi:hypothetical protein
LAGAGTQNEGLAFSGFNSSFVAAGLTEEYNGSTWSAGGAIGTPSINPAGAGTQNDALVFGGSNSSFTALLTATFEYNGSTWSSGGAMTTAKYNMGGLGSGQNAGLGFGGSGPSTGGNGLATTQEYNGTSWSNGGSLATAREFLAGAGTQATGLGFGGTTRVGSASLAATEEYTK